MSTDDFQNMAHVVIVETNAGIKLIEFDAGPESDIKAHQAAQGISLADGFHGRVIVALRIRVCGEFGYLKENRCI